MSNRKHSNGELIYRKCASQHFGLWMIQETWFQGAVAAFNAGILVPKSQSDDEEDDTESLFDLLPNGIARIAINGYMSKGQNSFGGTSTVGVRNALRMAAGDERCRAMMLHVDSPGGITQGTAELAADVIAANKIKPVYAHVEGNGCSAAYYAIAGCRRITANASSTIGSIGTYMVLTDSSKQAKAQGVKVTAVSSGPLKGQGIPGTELSDAYIAQQQEIVDGLTQQFVNHINECRDMELIPGKGAANGGYWLADKAQEMSLIDDVCSFEDAYGQICKDIMPPEPTRLTAAKSRMQSQRAKL
jgi:signal peptide peptidase SppA